MAANTDQSSGIFGGLATGFICLSMFGVASWISVNYKGPKSALELSAKGDFSGSKIAERVALANLVETEQRGAVNLQKIGTAMAGIKSSPQGPSDVIVPGSPTALKAAQIAPTAPPATKGEAVGAVPPAPATAKESTTPPPAGSSTKPPVLEVKPAVKVPQPEVKAAAPKAESEPSPEAKPQPKPEVKVQPKSVEPAPKPEVKAEDTQAVPVVE